MPPGRVLVEPHTIEPRRASCAPARSPRLVGAMPRQCGITPRIARRGVAHGSGPGKIRRAVERAFAWQHAGTFLKISRARVYLAS